jgi:hypothetical protein
MIYYFSRTQKTKIAACALGEVTGLGLYELEAAISNARGLSFAWKAVRAIVGAKGSPVSNLPADLVDKAGEEIWLCSPVWGGDVSGPVKYFINNMPLRGVRVNMLLTAMSPSHQNEKAARRLLERAGAVPGTVLLTATTKALPEQDIMREHLRELLAEIADK